MLAPVTSSEETRHLVETMREQVRASVEAEAQGRLGDGASADELWRQGLLDVFRRLFAEEPRPWRDVEQLGRVYEGLVVLRPGISRERVCRLRRGKLEAVVPASVGERYRGESGRSLLTRIRWIEEIPAGRFFTYAGLDRKTAGAYYTPRPLVRFMVRQALSPLIAGDGVPDRGRADAIVGLRVLDPAMGTGHFLLEACRFLGDELFEARGGGTRRSCRRLVAERCLRGVDLDPVAVELVRLALWAECGRGALPDEFMASQVVAGDALTGPSAAQLPFPPGVDDRRPWRTLARAWSGSVALGEAQEGERARPGYRALERAVMRGEATEPILSEYPELGPMLEAGAGAVAFELCFPDVFLSGGRQGFDAVVGNPPWDALRPRAKEFFADVDLAVLDASTGLERRPLESRLEVDLAVADRRRRYEEAFARQRRVHARLYRWQTTRVRGRLTGGDPDLWKLFMERSAELVRPGGTVGLLVPSAFHTNASAAGVRRLFTEQMDLRGCYSFDNRRGLFDIHRSYKFDAVLARRDGGGTRSFPCAFHLTELPPGDPGLLTYDLPFLRKVGGEELVFPELSTQRDVSVVSACHDSGRRFGDLCEDLGIALRSALHMTSDADRFTPARDELDEGTDPRLPGLAAALRERGYLPLHEGKTFHQFDDRWGGPPRYLVHTDRLEDRPRWLRAADHYRLAYRAVASATNERTGIFVVLPPGVLCGNSAPCEAEPWARPVRAALLLCALANSFCVDYLLRVRSSANVNGFILRQTAVPDTATLEPLLVHSALRLSCNHAGYEALWRDQLGECWREARAPGWPAVPADGERMAIRAAVDAAIASSFGLSAGAFSHILSTFTHRSRPGAPGRCVQAFEELQAMGLERFCRERDPYADVPLV